MSWLDGRTLDGFSYIYAQRLNGSGAKQWAPMGLKVSTLNAYTHDLAPGANGSVKVGLSVFADFALYGQLQLISATGTLEDICINFPVQSTCHLCVVICFQFVL